MEIGMRAARLFWIRSERAISIYRLAAAVFCSVPGNQREGTKCLL
jgi:hypothetical protein